MDPRRPGRTPSPGHPLQGYQLEDRYGPQGGPLDMPMGPGPGPSPGTPGDRLALQPSVGIPMLQGFLDRLITDVVFGGEHSIWSQ